MNWTDILREHITELIAIITGIMGGSYLERRRKKAEIKAADADATKKVMDIYQEALDDLKRRHDERIKELHESYEAKVKELEKKWESQFEQLRDEIKRLRANLELWKTKYRKLKEAFDEYRKKHGDQ